MRTYPADAHTIPGYSFGPNLRAILVNLHRMTPAVRPIAYGLKANHGAVISTGLVSNGLAAIAEYAKYGKNRRYPSSGGAARQAGQISGIARRRLHTRAGAGCSPPRARSP